ncbi:TolC family outer membrane protein [Sneathiella chungangensis]|uniref:TolC family outer membrane protein n=1 Tax=Sneathiella chungangensis TaxID=1418234 RepID=A0A845ME34_9PROT|nr:TolC family outer membrane protein [Sneathiella chungangensis]MZR21314.1 TolC family outer membrane protein [Sneathiella chungangensis]
MKKVVLTVASVLAVTMPMSLASAETLQDALASTYENNPTLQARRANVRSVDENVPQALSGWRPEVYATGEVAAQHNDTNVTTAGKDTNPREAALIVSQPIYSGGQTVASTKSAEATVQAARAGLLSAEQTIFQSAVEAYMNVLRDEALVELNQNNTVVLRRQLEAANDRFQVGEITRTDVAQAQARLADSISRLIQSEGNLRSTRANFERIVGRAPEALEDPLVPADFPESEEAALAIALDNHPDIEAAKYNEESSRYDIRATSGQLLPSVEVNGSLSTGKELSGANTSNDTARIGAVLTVPLYQSGSVYSQVRQARQVNSQRMQEIEETVRAVRESVIQAWELLETSRSRIGANEEAVRANTIALEGVEQEAQVGSRTTLDVLNAEQELLQSKVDLVTARRDQYVAIYSVLAAIGKLNARDLNLDVEYYDPATNYERVRNKWFGTDGGLD